MKKELTANAESLACSGRMPMISAAMSMSRIAIQERPMALRTRFLATSARTRTTKPAGTDTSRIGVGMGGDRSRPNSAARRRRDDARRAVVVPPGTLLNIQIQEELRRQRGDREVEALDAQAEAGRTARRPGRCQAGQQEHHDDVAGPERRWRACRRQGAAPP
jgi:GAF domain-containing protein